MLGSALLAVAIAASSESAAASDAKVDQLAKLIVERCVPAQKTLSLDLSDLPSTVARLGPDTLKQLGFKKDAFVLLFETRDGQVVFAPGQSCSANTLEGGGIAYVEAVERGLRERGYQITDVEDKPSPDAAHVRLRSIRIPLGERKIAVVVSSYSSPAAAPDKQLIYVSVFSAEKPN